MAQPLPGFEGAPYFTAAGEIIWVGPHVPAMHPRVVVTDVPPPRRVPFRLTAIPSRGWRARLPHLDRGVTGKMMERVESLRRELLATSAPRGFGACLAGMSPGFPLELGIAWVDALRRALEQDDPRAALAPARSLLGFGTGLTPSGDDLVGGALFGRRFVARQDRRWANLANRLAREIRIRSHSVSAALFADLAAGRSFAPLHELADALAAGDDETALSAALALASIGHSSGWDMLAGFFIAIPRVRAPGRR